ncbi:ALP1-like protein [Tanacetum coccineum]
MNSYTFMGVDLEGEEEVTSRKKTFIKRAIAFIKNRRRANRVTRNHITRDRSGAHERLVAAFFSKEPMYDEVKFRKTFRMARPLFNEIVTACTSSIRQLAYGVHAEFLDEYMQISEITSRMDFDHFCQSVMQIYGPEYLRKPTVTDVEKLYLHHEEDHEFPGMLGSLDFTDWELFGCPYAFKAQYIRRDHGPNPFVLLEAVASQDLWIWHAFFGVAGSNNDINVLYQSPLFKDLKTGRALKIPFVANDVTYPSGYYLVDGIYPELAPLVKTIPEPTDDDHKRILYKQNRLELHEHESDIFMLDLPIIRFEDLQERRHREVEEMCFICSVNYERDDVVSQLNRCGHVFHTQCVGKLIHRKQHDCPFCRSSFFSGCPSVPWDDPERWIFAITEYFSLLNTLADQRFRIVGFNLEGVAVEWFRWMSRNGLITTWDRFVESVKNRFESSKYEDPQGALSKLLQLGTVEDYTCEFEKLMNRVEETEAHVEATVHKEKATTEKEETIKETADTLTSLQSEVASLEAKGSVKKLPMELQSKNNVRGALETKDLKKMMIDLNSTLHDLQEVKTKCALKIDDEEFKKAKSEATKKIRKLTKVYDAWLPPWLASRLVVYQPYVKNHWKEFMFIQGRIWDPGIKIYFRHHLEDKVVVKE